MKAIQIMIDDETLARLDADAGVQREGRSAVLRRAANEYLHRQECQRIAAQYREAYSGKPGLGEKFTGWEYEGAWPND